MYFNTLKNKHINRIVLLLICLGLHPLLPAQDAPLADWSDVDFSDTTLVKSEAFRTRMINTLYTTATDGDLAEFDSVSMACIGTLLEKAKVNMRVYEYVLEFMLNGYTNMGRTQVVDYLLNYPMLIEGEVSMEEGLRLDSITEPYQLVKVGATAPDYKGVTIDGKPYSLHGSKANMTIVFFWSTDCEYCHDFLVQLRKHLDLKTDYELVTFALAGDKAEVEKTVKKMRLPGYHFYDDMRWDGKAFLDYHVTSTPTVFLLDENKTIVCKPFDWEELKYWLKSNNINF